MYNEDDFDVINKFDDDYKVLLKDILKNGTWQQNRTGIKTKFIPGAMIKYDLHHGFPATTLKKLAFKAVKGELIGFLRGYTNAAQFRELDCKIWDQNANENKAWLENPNRKGTDDLGMIYGAMWRRWPAGFEKEGWEYNIDQVNNVMQKLYTDPTDRRMIISGWRPDYFDKMALPPCHVLYQFIANVETRELHLCMYQRSCDYCLGVNFNVASASMFLVLMANLTGFTPGTFTHFMADVHVYENHIEGANQLLTRTPYRAPNLVYTGPVYDGINKFDASIFYKITPDMFTLVDYTCHSAINLNMAV